MKSYLPKIMSEKKLTIYDLVAQTGLSKQTITRARDERIRHCSLSTLKLIASALEVRITDLYCDGQTSSS